MKKTLYLGTHLPESFQNPQVVHFPIIKIIARPPDHPEIEEAFTQFDRFTHLLFTSRNGVEQFFDYANRFHITTSQIRNKFVISVGSATARTVTVLGGINHITAQIETSEGVILELEKLDLREAYVLWPHSSLSRSVLINFFHLHQINHCSCILYDTIPYAEPPLPNLDAFDQIFFTSPSTIDAFIKFFGEIPSGVQACCIGPITQNHYNRLIN